MKNFFYLPLILISLLTLSFISCDKEKVIQKEDEVLLLESNYKIDEKAVIGQYVVLSAKFNGEDVTLAPETSFFINGEKVQGNRFEITEGVPIKICAEYKKVRSNELQIEVVQNESLEESKIYLELNANPNEIPVGKTVIFTVKNATDEELTEDVKFFFDGLEIVGNTYTFDKVGMYSLYAKYKNVKSEVIQCIVKETVSEEFPDEKNTIKVIRNFYDEDLIPISTDATSLKVELYGFNDDEEKEINVYNYNIDGKEVKCTRWNIDFEKMGIGCQTSFSIMVPLEDGKFVTPDKAQNIYVYSLNMIFSDNNSLTLSAHDKKDLDVLKKVSLKFEEFGLGNLRSEYQAELNISFKGTLRATMHDNFMKKELDTMIHFICNPSIEQKRLNTFRIQNDTMDVVDTFRVKSLKDVFN